MFYPWTWHDLDPRDPNIGPLPRNRWKKLSYPQPEIRCQENWKRKKNGEGILCSKNSIHGAEFDWFTNYTFIPGQPTLPNEMYDQWANIKKIKKKKHPWTAPGSAPAFGEGCGVNGGNPNGCKIPNIDTRPYGSCCAQVGYRCGAYAHGKSAMEHAAEGLFDGAATTSWFRGGFAEVYWASGAKHRHVVYVQLTFEHF